VVGKVRRAHGIRGELVVESMTDAPDAVFASGRRVFAGTKNGKLSADQREMRIGHATPFKGGWIVGFEGIATRSEAETWRDRFFLLPEDEIAPPGDDETFIHDLVGMRVVHVDGTEIGVVAQVLEMPQGLMLDVKRQARGSVLLQYDDHTVTDVDADARVIRVDPVEGLID
jgi:16S rRNA processing protein RimM